MRDLITLIENAQEVPSVVYHGTCRSRWAQDKSSPEGLYVTVSRDVALGYAREWEEEGEEGLLVEISLAAFDPAMFGPNEETIEQVESGSWGDIGKSPDEMTWLDTLRLNGTFTIRNFDDGHKGAVRLNLVESATPGAVIYFLRDTANPKTDLARGFSCHTHGWCSTEQEARAFQQKRGALRPPIQDPVSGNWCADPELGLSGFAFWSESSFYMAVGKIEGYALSELHGLAVFASDDYDLDAGADGEDVFRNGRFIGRVSLEPRWTEFLELTASSSKIVESAGADLNKVCQVVLAIIPEADEIWFHGSRATGKHKRKSDWDFYVFVPDNTPKERLWSFAHVGSPLDRLRPTIDVQVGTRAEVYPGSVAYWATEEGRVIWRRGA